MPFLALFFGGKGGHLRGISLFSEGSFMVFVFWRLKEYLTKNLKKVKFSLFLFYFLYIFPGGGILGVKPPLIINENFSSFRFLEDKSAFNQNKNKTKTSVFLPLLLSFFYNWGSICGGGELFVFCFLETQGVFNQKF